MEPLPCLTLCKRDPIFQLSNPVFSSFPPGGRGQGYSYLSTHEGADHQYQYILAIVFITWPLVVILSGSFGFYCTGLLLLLYCFLLLSNFSADFILLCVLLFPSWLLLLNGKKKTTAQKEQLRGQTRPHWGFPVFISLPSSPYIFPASKKQVQIPSRELLLPASKFTLSSSLSTFPVFRPSENL